MPSNNTSRHTTAADAAKSSRVTVLATSPATASVRGDCYDVRDMYTACVQLQRTGSPICDAVVNTYLKCSASEK